MSPFVGVKTVDCVGMSENRRRIHHNCDNRKWSENNKIDHNNNCDAQSELKGHDKLLKARRTSLLTTRLIGVKGKIMMLTSM